MESSSLYIHIYIFCSFFWVFLYTILQNNFLNIDLTYKWGSNKYYHSESEWSWE